MFKARFRFRRLLLSIGLVAFSLPALSLAGDRQESAQAARPHAEFDRIVAGIRADGGIPGIVAMGLRDRQLWISSQGVRRLGSVDIVRASDRFHIGSNIKSMTATVIARLVERRRLRWDSTLGQMFPDMPMDPRYRSVTLEQLLQHRAGVIPLGTLDEVEAVPAFKGTPKKKRLSFARWALAQPPAAEPGSFQYSNGGYAIAGAVIDRYSGMPYEIAMREYLFKPLGIDARFDWPASNDPRQPWGHADIDGSGTLTPTDPLDPRFQFPAWLRPAGDLSMNIADYAKYIALHAEAGCGRPRLLRASTFRRLHAVPVSADGEAYSMGWSEFEQSGRRFAFHSGSGGNFYATVAYDESCGRGIAIFANSGAEAAAIAIETAALEWMK
jgi:D-alanyl-D-alanine carboxypeptidase